ncbi:unnamed protein product [Cylicostephanus goldi]|uniref:G-protein coupled receptors family 1 profile domain-containing protein n=1 Tax=Cylicostephanus goldi TaxID=71465 RepID=A0A3P7PUA6_CYLGO|nr:unnamed protein product [Cylicostephanus goldi]
MVTNALANFSLLYDPLRRNSFCILCFSHITSNLGVLLIFLLYAVPSTLGQKEVAGDQMNKIMGQLTVVFWYATAYSHLAISVNRLVAIALPFQAAKLLTRPKSFLLVLVIWCIGLCHAAPYFWSECLVNLANNRQSLLGTYCYVYYDCRKWRWIIAESQCGKILIYVAKFSMFILIVKCVIDVVAVVKFRKINKVFASNTSLFTLSEVQKRKRRMEVKFFKQTLRRNGLFLVVFVNFHYISPLFDDRWLVYLTSTFAWQLLHALDGCVLSS